MCSENKEAGSLSSVGLFEEFRYRSLAGTFQSETMEDGTRYAKLVFFMPHSTHTMCFCPTFQVPNRFLEVAEITLHEFFNALYLGKDSDPSWKKAIYKVICKLDSDVPEEFKTSSYL